MIDVSSFIENIHATYQCVKFVGRSMEEMFSGGGFAGDDFDAFADDIYMILNMTVTAPIWTSLSYYFQILAK